MFRPETVTVFRNLYESKKDTVEYLIKFGNEIEKAKASLVKEIACQNF